MDLDILKWFIDKELTHIKIGLINRFATDEMTLADMKCAFSPQAGACVNMNLDIIGDEYDLEEVTDYARDAITSIARQTWLEYEAWQSEMNGPAFKQLTAIEQELRVTKFTLNAICNALNVRIQDKQHDGAPTA